MTLTRFAIQRPVATLMAIGAVLVIGLVGWSKLGVELLPAVDMPVVVVTTAYPGAGPEAIDTLVTKPIEDAVASLNDIDYIQSNSVEGLSTVTIVFTERAGRESAIDVERRITAVRDKLPSDIRDPNIAKFDPNAQPILQLTLRGGAGRDLGTLQRLAEDRIQKTLERANGVAQVTLIGGQVREIQVQVDQQKLHARGVSILQVNHALSADNLDVPAGSITQRGKDWSVRLDNQAQTPAVLADVLVASTPHGRVYLRDVATVVDTYKKVSSVQRTNGDPALGVVVLKQASANTVETADSVKRAIAQLRSELPPDLELSVVSDASVFTRGSIDEVQRELAQAVLLTGLVLLLFLHTLRSTVIVLLAIPTSLIATLGVMYFPGLSLNTMTLLAITLTVGILVDDSIVVLENIFRHLHLGETPLEAAINGRSEIGFAAIAITLVDVVVFAPIAFMSGPTGQYFRQFGLVVVAATLFSLLVSFTLTPMLASRWFSSSRATTWSSKNPLSRFGRIWDRGYARLAAGYGQILRLAIGARGRWAVVAISLASFAAGVALIVGGVLSTEFMPSMDTGELQVFVEMPAGTSLEVTSSATQVVEDRVLAWPEVEHAFTSVGVGNSQGASLSGPRVATITVQLLERRQRSRTPDDLAVVARDLGADIPGARITAIPSSLFGANNGSNQIVVRVLGDDSAVLASLARQVAGVVRNTAGTSNVDEGGAIGEPQLLVEVDRSQAADLGLTPGDVASVLRTGLAGSVVSTFRPAGTSGWDIAVILNPEERQRVEQVGQIPILTPSGSTIQLGQVASVTSASGPAKIYRRDRQRTVYVTAIVNGRTTGDAAREIQRGIEHIGVPAGYRVTQAGVAQSQAEAFGQIITALVLSLVLMYMLMAALFESVTYPLMIMFSLPLAIVGALGALALTGNTLNMMSMIGQILLMGLVGKNAILLVDCANTLRRQGVHRDAALLQAGPMRLRPILMTTAALVLAMLPVAMKVGEGSEWRAPMAVTVIGGLLTSTLLTLVLIPAAYTLVDDAEQAAARLISRVRLAFSRRQEQGTPTEARPTRTPIPIAGGSDAH